MVQQLGSIIVGNDLIFSGGGYFRLFPYSTFKKFTVKLEYVMTYFHPRDFDANQPMVPGLSAVRKFKSYYGLKHTEEKLRKWLSDFEFVDLHQANLMFDFKNVVIIIY